MSAKKDNSKDNIYVVGAARTEFGRFDGEDNDLA